VGAAFESYVKDAFAGILGQDLDEETRERELKRVFSWLGDDNKSPDAMLRGGIALEIKKSEASGAALSLNSSAPRQKLLADDPRVSSGAKAAETWTERDLAYVVGHTSGNQLRRLWIVYGDCLAASAGTYQSVFDLVKESIEQNLDHGILEANTTELAKLKRVDAQGRADLRVRPMWSLESPDRAFSHLLKGAAGKSINLLLRESTFNSLPLDDRQKLDQLNFVGVQNKMVLLPDPDNVNMQIEARFLTYEF
jgi:hypothetical protein